MQAIEAVENAALELPRRSSPFRALVWKEWRQQRWIYLSLTGLAYLLLVTALIVSQASGGLDENRPNYVRDMLGVLCGCAALLGIVGVAVLSANAFAGEREDNTEQFLATIPCSRSKLFDVKLGFVLFLVLMELIPLAAAGLICIGLVPHEPNLLKEVGPLALEILVAALVLATVPALIASFGGSVIATILASIPVVIACLYYQLAPILMTPFVPVRSATIWNVWAIGLYAVLMLATIFLAARRMWIRIERTWRSSLRTAAATAGLLIAFIVVPPVAAYIYVTFFAPLSFFLSNRSCVAARLSTVSPDGKHVTFDTSYSGWGWHGSQVALTDTESGRTRWLTRFRSSAFQENSNMVWSPSGNQFVLMETDARLWPLAMRYPKGRSTCFVVDAQSGEKHSFEELCPGRPVLGNKIGWYNEHVYAFQTEYINEFEHVHLVIFADIEHHQVHQCIMPPAIARGLNVRTREDRGAITRRGILTTPEFSSANGDLLVLRYAPDLPQAESLVLRGLPPNQQALILPSDDGQWLLQGVGAKTHQIFWYLAPVADGAKATLLVSENPDERDAVGGERDTIGFADAGDKGAIKGWWGVSGFIPNSHQILLYSHTELGLFDADSHDVRRIPLPQADGRPIATAVLSPRGGFALVGLSSAVGGAIRSYLIADLHKGTSWAVNQLNLQWLGEDHLLSQPYGGWMPLVLNRDGTKMRPLLAN